MTRMLGSITLLIFLTAGINGCSLFSSAENENTAAEVSTTDVSSFVEEDMAEEFDQSLDQVDAAITENQPEADLAGGDEFGDLDDFADEFQGAEIPVEQGEDPTSDFLFFSETDGEQVDQGLAGAELDNQNSFADDQWAADTSTVDPLTDSFGSEETALDLNADSNEFPAEEATFEAATDSYSVATADVTNLEYKSFDNGGTVVIETSAPVVHEVLTDTNLNQIVLELKGAKLPQRFKRPYITKDFKQDVATINAYQEDGSADVRVVIQLKRPLEPIVQVEGNSILVMTNQSTPMLQAGANEGTSTAEFDVNVSATKVEDFSSSSAESLQSTVLKEAGGESFTLNERDFSGEKMSIEVTDTDVRTIIDIIAQKSGVNLVMDDDVGGKTNLRLRNVPWDQALVVLLRSKALGYVKQGNVLRIAKQETLSKEAKEVSEQIKSEREAKLLSSGIKVKYIPVSYARVEDLATKLKDFISKEGKIAFDERTSSLVVTDYPEYIDRVKELVKALDTPPMQVEIAAKLVEARETFIREAGINWDISGKAINLNGGRTATISSGLSGAPQKSFSLDLAIGTFDIFGDLTAALNIFEQQDKVKVLSQPRIVTMNKTKASISQTTQIPVQTIMPQTGPGQTPIPSITYQDLNLSLEVTPQITFNGDVILDVELKREFPGQKAENGQVEINKRQAKTMIMVKNGKTAVIGGIYQLDDTDSEGGIPLLKDIPLVGYLFKSTTISKNKNELLLFLKPKILKEIEGTLQMSQSAAGPGTDTFDEFMMDEGAFENGNDSSTSTQESSDEMELVEEI